MLFVYHFQPKKVVKQWKHDGSQALKKANRKHDNIFRMQNEFN